MWTKKKEGEREGKYRKREDDAAVRLRRSGETVPKSLSEKLWREGNVDSG